MTTVSAFEHVVSTWNDRLSCEMTRLTGGQCRREARWRLNLHGCEQALMCGQHLAAWKRDALGDLEGGKPQCHHCLRIFDRLVEAYTVTPL